MKRSELKEAIKAEIKSVLSENRYDINDPNSPLGKLNDEYESSGLKGIVDKYGLDVVLMMLSSGEYGDRLNESVLTEEIQVGDIVTLNAGGDKLEVIDSRRMFGSDMMAYRVKKVDGTKFNANVDFPEIGDETVEYSSDQLRLAEGDLNEISSREANAQLEEIEEYQKSIARLVTQDLKNEPDIDAFIRLVLNDVNRTLTRVKNLKKFKGFQLTFSDIREDEEPTKAEVKKEKSIAKEKADALKAQKETKEKIDKIKSVLKKNKSEVLKISKIDRKERTKAEQSLFDNMVDKTKELKKLEKAL